VRLRSGVTVSSRGIDISDTYSEYMITQREMGLLYNSTSRERPVVLCGSYGAAT
jgi:hypothetical protein